MIELNVSMKDFLTVLHQAISRQQSSPTPTETLSALVMAEKNSRLNKPSYQFEQFVGSWRLFFINGTNQSRSRFANLFADGIYLPAFIPIKISYHASETPNQGKVVNTVTVGLVQFTLEGPCKFVPTKQNILAFDFTYLTMFVLGAKIFSRNIRGGKDSDEKFFNDSLKQQAFFSYFLVTDKLIAARGRGGGLALWSKI